MQTLKKTKVDSFYLPRLNGFSMVGLGFFLVMLLIYFYDDLNFKTLLCKPIQAMWPKSITSSQILGQSKQEAACDTNFSGYGLQAQT